MKRVSLVAAFLLFWISIASASSSQAVRLESALFYAKDHQDLPFREFLKPWTNLDLGKKKNTPDEYAYCYTPYLIVAQDARQSLLAKKKLQLAHSEKLWQDYEGFWIFKVYVKDLSHKTPQKVYAQIDQNENVFYPVQSNITIDSSAQNKDGTYIISHFYFEEKAINKNEPLRLTVHTPDYNQHYFYFDPKQLQ